jgi:hypothetical protein
MYCRLNNIGAEIAQARAGTTDEFWFDYGKKQEIFLFSYTVGIGVHTPKQGSKVVKLITYFHLAPRLRMSGSVPPLSIMPFTSFTMIILPLPSTKYKTTWYLEFPKLFPL